MLFVTADELSHFRTQLADEPTALRALDMIEDCEGDLEDAAIALALRVGQEPDQSEQWLMGLAKRWRVFMCQPDIQTQLTDGSLSEVVRALASETALPVLLATPVVIYVVKTGIEPFCLPLQEIL